MGMLSAIGQGLKAIGAIFSWAQQRDAEENAPAMQANAAARADADAEAQAAKDVNAADPTGFEKDIS